MSFFYRPRIIGHIWIQLNGVFYVPLCGVPLSGDSVKVYYSFSLSNLIILLKSTYISIRGFQKDGKSVVEHIALFLWPVFFFYVIANVYCFSKAELATKEPHLFYIFLGLCHSSNMVIFFFPIKVFFTANRLSF